MFTVYGQADAAAIVRAEDAERNCADLREEMTSQQSIHAVVVSRLKHQLQEALAAKKAETAAKEAERAAKEAAEARVHELEQQLRANQRQLSALDLVGIAAPIQYALENDTRAAVSMNISFSTTPMKPRRNNDYEREEDES